MSLVVTALPVSSLLDGFLTFLPNLISGTVFLFIAFVGIRFLTDVTRKGLEARYKEPVLVDLGSDIAFGFMWFGAILITLSLLGFDDIASSMGTASGFVALGVAFALKDMIADVVSGVRLIQDEDFMPGDSVKAADMEGEVVDIDLRKTRLDLESGDRAVVSNKDVEKKWTKVE